MTQTRRLSKNNTKVMHNGLGMTVILHDTIIIQLRIDGTLILDSGGWRTATTKTRMNQFANEHCGGRFHVYQKKGEWYVRFPYLEWREDIPFEDGMEIRL